jgi:hypothetical protein
MDLFVGIWGYVLIFPKLLSDVTKFLVHRVSDKDFLWCALAKRQKRSNAESDARWDSFWLDPE